MVVVLLVGAHVPYVVVYVPRAFDPVTVARVHSVPTSVHPSGQVWLNCVFVSPVGQQYFSLPSPLFIWDVQSSNDRHIVIDKPKQGGVNPTTNANGRLIFIKCFIIVSPECLLLNVIKTCKKPSKFDGQEVRNNHKELCAYSVRRFRAHYSQPS